MKKDFQILTQNTWWNIALLAISSAGIASVSLLLAIGNGQQVMFFDYYKYPLTFVLNYVPVLLVQALCWCITGRQWAGFLICSTIILGASAGDYYKLAFRAEPFLFTDIPYINAALGIANEYSIMPNARIYLAGAAIVAGSIALALLGRKKLKPGVRIISILLLLITVYPLWKCVYSPEDIYKSPLIVQRDYDREMYRTASKGFVYPFIHSIRDAFATPPEGYSKAESEKLLAQYPDNDIPEGKHVNIIAVQLEAFSDLRETGIDGINDKAYAYYDELREECLSGKLVVNVNGGSTIDTEQSFLTGDYQYSKVKAKAPSFVWYMKGQRYHTTGGHPYYSVYRREFTNPLLGFDDYRLCDNYAYPDLDTLPYGRNYSDEFFFDSIYKQYRELSGNNENVFSFNVTMQGHGPYDTENLLFGDEWFDSDCSESTKCIVNNYLGSLENTQHYLKKFMDMLRNEEEPVVVILYGDHKPWLGDNSCAAQELGIKYDTSTEEGFFNYYSTNYLIWGNDAAKEACSNSFSGNGPTISVCYLMPLLFREIGWEGCGYANYLLERMGTLNVITSNGLYCESGEYTNELSDEGLAMLRNAEFIQYYREHKNWKDKEHADTQ